SADGTAMSPTLRSKITVLASQSNLYGNRSRSRRKASGPGEGKAQVISLGTTVTPATRCGVRHKLVNPQIMIARSKSFGTPSRWTEIVNALELRVTVNCAACEASAT